MEIGEFIATPLKNLTNMLRLASRSVRRLPALRSFHATSARLADDASGAAAGGMSFNFTLPAGSLYENAPMEMVILPGVDGEFALMRDHVPTIAELKPGVVQVQETSGGALTKYFISGGFASSKRRPCPTLHPAAVPSPPVHCGSVYMAIFSLGKLWIWPRQAVLFHPLM